MPVLYLPLDTAAQPCEEFRKLLMIGLHGKRPWTDMRKLR